MSLALLMLVLACSNVARAETDSALPDREQELFIRSHSHVSVVRPERVDGAGRFLSHALAHRPAVGAQVFYRLQHEERPLLLNLTLNPHLLAQDHLVETRGGGAKNRTERRTENTCHLLGTVTDGHTRGTAAISTCHGLVSGAAVCSVDLIDPIHIQLIS
uniref:Peptidase M12B propeptide domain-containing protein n=1 Tax=Astyanax mexicanus TaxID=7994 RepID=A0A8B9HMH3_ASTMX